MKKLLSLFFIISSVLTACGTAQTPVAASAETSTQTPTPPTSTLTPLPTIPTFTPTFDVSMNATGTPAEKAVCPKEYPSLKPDMQVLFDQEGLSVLDETKVLDFLNSGGSPGTLISTFMQEFNWFQPDTGIQQDVTGDRVDDFILNDRFFVYIFGCKNADYQIWLKDSIELNRLLSIQFNTSYDLNLNGMPEIITEIQGHGGLGYPYKTISIFEWNGSEFTPLIQEYKDNHYFPFVDMEFLPDVDIYDTDGNGTLELILKSNAPSPIPQKYAHLIPWRDEKHYYAWNGAHFSLNRVEFTKPQYLFQALQDAEQESFYRNYDRALSLYQDVIFNNELKTWSPAIAENEIAKAYAEGGSRSRPTPVPNDPAEYPSLATYAYYRIILLHLAQGQESEAASTYQTLQETFGTDSYATRYVEMATVFWNAYQSTQRMYDGCAEAIQFAVEHPEILVPLGSSYHGSQSKIYKPEDICPFR